MVKRWRRPVSRTFSGHCRGSGNHGVSVGDLDNDGANDIFVSYGGDRGGDQLWWNDGTGVFTAERQLVGDSLSFRLALGDVDEDGDLDVVVDDEEMPSRVLLKDGRGRFVDSGHPIGTERGQYTALGDLDGDGDLDAFVAVDVGEDLANQVWLNDDETTPEG